MTSYPLEGPDVSYAQGAVNPANFPGQFAIVNASRANIGRLAVGSYYHQQVDAFRGAGRHIGHYFFNGNINATICGTFFVNNLYDDPDSDTYHLDVEDEPGTGTVHWTPAQVLEFDDVFFTRRGKHITSVYLNKSIRDAYDWSAVKARGIQLWLAYYNSTLPPLDEFGQPIVWQYTSAGYDHNRATASLLTWSTGGGAVPIILEDDDMLLITSPARGYFVIGAGYSRQLRNNEELQAALSMVSKTLSGDDRHVDVWNAIALQGTAASDGATLTLTDADIAKIKAALGTTSGTPSSFNINLSGTGVPA